MRKENVITNFQDHDALDPRLPLREKQAKEIAPDFGEVIPVIVVFFIYFQI